MNRRRLSTGRSIVLAALVAALGVSPYGVRAGETASPQDLPDKYTLNYPVAEEFVPPVADFFDEVSRSLEVVRGRKFTHQPNGGYGLPVVMQVEGQNLLHLGADVGWHRTGSPVYAVAAGVVRHSDGPPPPSKTSASAKAPPKPTPHGTSWGNGIFIEHRLADGTYLTTLYGHLGVNRLVKRGDVVRAGQQIGTIGGKHPLVNGGYTPHLHFAVRQGRLAEPGCTLLQSGTPEQLTTLKLTSVTEDEVELEVAPQRAIHRLTVAGRDYAVTEREGKYFAPARLLWDIPRRPGFELAGYGLSTEGWLDPVAALRQYGADRRGP